MITDKYVGVIHNDKGRPQKGRVYQKRLKAHEDVCKILTLRYCQIELEQNL